MSTRTVKAPRLTRVSPQGQLVIAALRALPESVRKAVFQELFTDALLRTELEAALLPPLGKETEKPTPAFPRLVQFELGHPIASAKALANTAAERIAAASYPYVIHASAKLVAFSGWMAHNYVKHAHNGAHLPLQASPQARRTLSKQAPPV